MSRPPEPRSCAACGTALLPPAKRCPGCGAAVPPLRGMRPAAIAGLALSVGFTCVLGLLLVSGVSGLLRRQLRSRELDVKGELYELMEAELAALERDEHFVEFAPFPAAPPGKARRPLSGAERELAARLGWRIGPTTYGQFRIAVARLPSGEQAASLCAETDLDGDGRRGARVVFLPAEREDGTLAAPPAPCTAAVPFDPDRHRPGELTRVEELED